MTSVTATRGAIRVLGAPLDLGQSRRGVDLGPTALRYAGLKQALIRLGYAVDDRGNIETVERDTLAEESGVAFLEPVVDACARIYQASREAVADGAIPLVLGGDHSIALGTVGGASHDHRVGVLWVDAHGDFNTPTTSPTGNLHGMPLAALCGRGAAEMVDLGRAGPKVKPEDVVLFGVRSLDPGERELIREVGVTAYTMREIDERGIGPLAAEALERLRATDRLHVSLDLDAIDPREAPGVGTAAPGGLTYRESHLLMELISEQGSLGSVDVVEVNPILDTRNQTAKLALDLICSLFGRTILGP